MHYSHFAPPLLLSAAVSAFLAWYGLARRHRPDGLNFGIMMLGAAWWSLAYALGMMSDSLSLQVVFGRLMFIGALVVQPLFLTQALLFTLPHRLNRRNVILILLPTASLLALLLTDPLHHLWFPQIGAQTFHGRPFVRSTASMSITIHIILGYLYNLVGLGLCVSAFLRKRRPFRTQAGFLIIGAAIILAATLASRLGWSPFPWGLGAPSFSIGGLFVAIAITRHHFLDLVPMGQHAILEHMPHPVLVLDPGGRIADSNHAAEILLGHEGDDLIGLTLSEAVQGTDLAEALLQVVAEPAAGPIEVAHGEQILGLRAIPLHQSWPAPTGQLIFADDVTPFRKLSQLKDEFVATVSHDMRSPLTSIIGYAQHAQSSGVSRSDQVEALRGIEKAAHRLSLLNNRLLDLARIRSGLDAKHLRPVHLDSLADGALANLNGAALAKNIVLTAELESHPPVLGDARLLLQVWDNLISNAIKYTAQGQVTARVYVVDGWVYGTVTDTGIGIAESELPLIFDKFFRSKHQEAARIEGDGLGLALVKSIVDKHGGRVWVESELNVGSTFGFSLPIKDHPVEDSQPQ